MTLSKRVWTVLLLALLFGAGQTACGVAATQQQSGQPASSGQPVSGAVVTLGTPFTAAASTKSIRDLSELPQGAVSHVDVVYFHRTERCESCLNAESYTRETLETHFAEQLKNGWLSLRVLDVEKGENAALVKKFDAAGSALYLSVLIQGTEYLCPNQDIWFLTTNKYLFVETLKKKLTALIGRG